MKYTIMLFLILNFSCGHLKKDQQKEVSKVIILKNEGSWKTNFKNEVFNQILFKMYGKDFVSCCMSKDASGTANYDWLNYDSLTEKRIKKTADEFMKNKFINGNIEGVSVKLNFALAYRLSYQLDSLTGIYYKKYQKDSSLNFIQQ